MKSNQRRVRALFALADERARTDPSESIITAAEIVLRVEHGDPDFVGMSQPEEEES